MTLIQRECTTHHHACSCREAQFKELIEAAREASQVLEFPGAAGYRSGVLERLKAALANLSRPGAEGA